MSSRHIAWAGVLAGILAIVTTASAFPKIDVGKVKKARETLKEVKRLLPISTDEEILIGKRVASRFQETYGVYKNPAVEEYVALVGTAVSWQGSRRDVDYNFSILDTDEINAYAAPGGFIMISKGLLYRMQSEAELAAILGHEIWHVEARHEMKRVQKAQIAGTLASKALSAMSGEELTQVTDLCYDVLEKGRSKESELEADVEGARLSSRVGYTPRALVTLLERLGGEPSEGALRMLMATHPSIPERIKELRGKYGNDATGSLLEIRFAEHTKSLRKS